MMVCTACTLGIEPVNWLLCSRKFRIDSSAVLPHWVGMVPSSRLSLRCKFQTIFKAFDAYQDEGIGPEKSLLLK